MADTKTNSQGRGWHGDSKAHAEAGRKGGRARSRNNGRSSRRGRSSESQ
ncbi:MAG: hypothetical protein NUV98_04760 [Candidatus Roizmanbacteria bacterium]|nr:hypothetical protein [Candidatus Roizmanbacteria bacterium]